MKNAFSVRLIQVSIIFVFGVSCSKNESEVLGSFVPLKCEYPGSLDLDQQTQDALSQYQQSPLQEHKGQLPRVFPKFD